MMKTKITISLIAATIFLLAKNEAMAQSSSALNTYNAAYYLGWSSANDLPFKINGSTYLTLKSTTGYFGIGTTAPLGTFDVAAATGAASWTYLRGNVNATKPSTSFTGGLAIGFNYTNAQGEVDFMSSKPYDFGGNGGFRFQIWDNTGSGTVTDLVTILGSGNTGIGTTTPASKLDVEGGVSIGATYSGTTAAPTNGAIIEGNVGIGTTAPLATLQLKAATSKEFQFGNTAGAYTSSTYFTDLTTVGPIMNFSRVSDGAFVNSIFNYTGTGSLDQLGIASRNDIVFVSSNSPSTTIKENMRITGGNVGIGTSAPATKLHITGDAASVDLLKLQNTNSTNPRSYRIGPGAGIAAGFGIYDDNAAATRMVINFSGNVGIGTTSPSRLLEVNGQMRTTNDSPEKPNAGSWTGYSDQRLKQNTAPFEDGLSVLRQVNPITFQFNGIGNLPTNETHIGVIAQNIQSVAPYCVKVGAGKLKVKQSEAQNFSGAEIIETLPPDSLGEVYTIISPLMYNYDGLIYVMINSIKQLDSTNTELLKNDSILMKKDSIKDAEIQAFQNLTTLYDTKFQQMQNRINQLDSMINSCCSLGSNRSMHLNTDSQISDSQVINSKDVELVNRQVVVLFQNSPNPFKEQTTIEYYLPDNVQRAQIIFFEQSGKLIKTVDLTEKGKGVLNVFASDLTNGTYLYSLIVDGQTVETKKMVKN